VDPWLQRNTSVQENPERLGNSPSVSRLLGNMGSEVRAASSLCSELNVPVEVSSIQTDRGSSDPTKDDDGSKTEQDAVSYNTEEENAKAEHSK
jgi:hypothetical protein